MACELLYNGLTTGAGTQTLGEEYCDILQVTGALRCSMQRQASLFAHPFAQVPQVQADILCGSGYK